MKKLIILYVLALFIVSGIWFDTYTANAPLTALQSQAALNSYLHVLVPYFVGCGVHYWKTGDPTPEPPMEEEPVEPVPVRPAPPLPPAA